MTLFDNVAYENPNVNRNEAPQGFYAVCKSQATTPNVCASCDARKLCQQDTDGWCIKNRCMGYAVLLNDGTQVQRADGCGVFFKRV